MSYPVPKRLVLLLAGALALLAASSSSALASGPPIVTANAATNLTLNTADLSGSINWNGGSETGAVIEYGKSKAYGKTRNGDEIYKSGHVTLAGLEPLTTYHYRIKAWNQFGTTYSNDVTFEMLLSWRVNGTPASELSPHPTLSPVWFNEEHEQVVTLENKQLNKAIGGVFKLGCEAQNVGHVIVMESEYTLPFNNCKATLQETGGSVEELPECNPPSTVIHLNAFATSTGTQYLNLGWECPVWDEIVISRGNEIGLEIGGFAEAEYNTFTFNTSGWTVTYGPSPFVATGEYLLDPFGIS